MKTLALLAALLISGCAAFPGTPGHISENISEFDNARELSMLPAWTTGGQIRLGLYWSSRMPVNEIVLVSMIHDLAYIPANAPLKLNIDGEIVSLPALPETAKYSITPGAVIGKTLIPPKNWTSRRYLATVPLVRKMISAQRVIVRMEIGSSEYVEGNFSSDAPTTARNPFREFLVQLEQTTNNKSPQ